MKYRDSVKNIMADFMFLNLEHNTLALLESVKLKQHNLGHRETRKVGTKSVLHLAPNSHSLAGFFSRSFPLFFYMHCG